LPERPGRPWSSEALSEPSAIYARVSTQDRRQDADNRIAQLWQFASTQNWEVVAEYVDHESGSRADRAEFRQLLVDAT
jgi:DNA invertase Pin-like site-specific DNA recombinase